MLDHLVGKPSANWKRLQIFFVLLAGSWVLGKGRTRHLPRALQKWNRQLDKNAPWKVALASWMAYYFLQNLFSIVGLHAPEPLARLYTRNFYRATWIMTALDAGFFTAMSLRPAWLRHICSVLFSAYYLVFADAAEERVRRVRATMSVKQMRLSSQKAIENPILNGLSRIAREKLTIQKILMVSRPASRSHLPPVELHIYYAGDLNTYEKNTTILLQFPGGGFVSMPPQCHADALAAWANQTKLVVCSINFGKAPEYTYPWAIEECFDLYCALHESRGTVIGLEGVHDLKIIALGDSAGGNVVTAVTLKILAHNQECSRSSKDEPTSSFYVVEENNKMLPIPKPIGLILIYPALDFEMSFWMSPAQLSLIREESKLNLMQSHSLENLWQSKDHFSHVSPLSVVPDMDKEDQSLWRRVLGRKKKKPTPMAEPNPWASTRLAMSSRMCFFNDRIISAEMMRAMALLYLGPHAYPDFESDYLLSPIVAPPELLAQFPATYMMCGEKDPLVDDTVIFAGRLRQARMEFGDMFDDTPKVGVKLKLLEGISHGFLHMMPFLPEARQAARTIGGWVQEIAREQLMAAEPRTEVTGAYPLSGSIDLVDHIAEIATTEKDMLHRRKQQIVHGLFSKETG